MRPRLPSEEHEEDGRDEAWRRYPRGWWILITSLTLLVSWAFTFITGFRHYPAREDFDLLTALPVFLTGWAAAGVLLWHFKPWRRGWL
jgi:drug/metabolite transporter (DMT)-like permease